MERCANTRHPAIQVWPAAAKMPAITPIDALATFASPNIMFGLLPPSSSVVPMKRAPAFCAIIAPVVVEPVKEILAIALWSVNALPASLPNPVTTLTTPSGHPASVADSANRRIVRDVYSLGLMTNEIGRAHG